MSVNQSIEVSIENCQTLILCESTKNGLDINFLQEVIQSLNILKLTPYHIKPKGSISEVLEYLENGLHTENVVTTKKLKSLVIIVDADEEPQKRFQDIVKKLSAYKTFNCPEYIGSSPNTNWQNISVFIYLFPNNQCKGSIETLCLETLDKKKMNCIKQYFSCLSSQSIDTNMTENILSKSQFRVFFASPNPNEYVKSILRVVDFNHASFQPLKIFLTKIFQN